MDRILIEPHSYRVSIQIQYAEPFTPEADIEIRRVRGRDGWRWFIRYIGLIEGPVLNRNYQWEYQSMPSERDEEELARTRYASFEEATEHVIEYFRRGLNEKV